MKREILVFGLVHHQHVLNFSKALKDYLGYEFIGFNNNPDFLLEKEEEARLVFKKIYKAWRCKVPVIDALLKSFSSLLYFFFIGHNSDLVLFHFLSKFVYPLASVSKIRGKKTCVFVYGSDFLRADGKYRAYISKVFDKIDFIVCDSTEMLKELKDSYPMFTSKMECCFFGSRIIDEMLISDFTSDAAKNKLNICPVEKKVVMCGYNGSMSQNHFRIIDSLLPYKDSIHFLFPMTYGCGNDYRNEVRYYCEQRKLSFSILPSFIEDHVWLNYIYATDIFVHMQSSDAFSSCVSENLMAGNVVINSDWIKYPDLEKESVFFIPANFNNLPFVFNDVLEKFREYKGLSAANKHKILKFKGLEYTVRNYWGPYFESICNS